MGTRRATWYGVLLWVALGMNLTPPAEAAVPFDGDLVEVLTDKITYYSWEPILLMAKYSNVGNEAQNLTPLSPGGLEAFATIYPVGGYTPAINYLPLENTLSGGSVYVWPHSAVVVRQKTIAPYTLKPGTYVISLALRIKSSTGVYYLESFSSTMIRVR